MKLIILPIFYFIRAGIIKLMFKTVDHVAALRGKEQYFKEEIEMYISGNVQK